MLITFEKKALQNSKVIRLKNLNEIHKDFFSNF